MNKVHFALVLVALVYASVVNANLPELRSSSKNDSPIANETTNNKTIHQNSTIAPPITIAGSITPNITTAVLITTTVPITTTAPITTTVPTTTAAPNTTVAPNTTAVPITTSTTPPSTSTFLPSTTTETPPSGGGVSNSVFFLGGFVLGLGLLAIAYVVYKFYKNRGDLSYRTL